MTETIRIETEHEHPRELVPGIHWLGGCLAQLHEGKLLHAYNSVYVVSGDDCSVIVETGHPQDVSLIESQLERLLERGIPEIRYIFTTHSETPHAGGLGRYLQRFPNAVACGDAVDLHLVFPQYADRIRSMNRGDSLDLGGTRFVAVEAVIRDMPYTRWGFDTRRRALFPGDGFAYSHYHADGHCGCVAEEVPALKVPDMTALFAELALYWTKFVDLEPYIDRLRELVVDELAVELIGPTHGLPITDVARTLPAIEDGLRLGARHRIGSSS